MRLEDHVGLLSKAGATRVYLKALAANDNSKNQIYLGGDFEAVNLLPIGDVVPDPENATYKAPLAFRWLLDDGSSISAPGAQLILYPQYPEVRLSALLAGARGAPSQLVSGRLPGRVLFLGTHPAGYVLARIDTPESEAARELRAREQSLAKAGVFLELPVAGRPDTRRTLLAELGRIHRMGWIPSRRLSSSRKSIECNSPNCGGYTLEAELGIIPNGKSDPDYLGWEVKQYGVDDIRRPDSGGPITLMTPEPTGGTYVEDGVEVFVRRFGYPDLKGRPDRLNFGGIHKVGETHARTGLVLRLDGFDATKLSITDARGGIVLVDKTGTVAARWDFPSLLSHWSKKHAQAVYVPSECRTEPVREYRYGADVHLGEGTDFVLFLRAMQNGQVYYDPGIKLENASGKAPTAKRRSQFRVRFAAIEALYRRTERTSAQW